MKSAMHCTHANEVPSVCPCLKDCYCKEHTCKRRVSVADVPVPRYQLSDEEIWLQMWQALAIKGVGGTERGEAADKGLTEFKKRFR